MNELKKGEDGYLYINKPYAEAYIPEDFFNHNKDKYELGNTIALEYGSGFQVIGLFNMKFFNDNNIDNVARDAAQTFTFNFPNMIETYPSSSVSATLTISGVTDKYRVLQYELGDIMSQEATTQSVTNCERFMSLVTSGKIPQSIGYDENLMIWMENFDINGIDPGVPSVVLQAIIAEKSRAQDDYSVPFRKRIGIDSSNVGQKDFKQMNLNEIAAYSSVMAGLSFERITDKITTALNMSYNDLPQKKSPIEQVITM